MIFEKFPQANARVSYQHGGTGLGLALSRELADLLGKGACFTLAVPTGAQVSLPKVQAGASA